MKIGQIIGFGVLGAFLTLPAATGLFADGGDTTLIHACVASDGTMRIVSPTTACKKNETPLHWATTARVVTDETRITNTENKNTAQDSSISAIQTKNTQQDADIAALQGQVGGASGGLVVKDSQGQAIGKLIDPTVMFLKIGNDALTIAVSAKGFAPTISAYFFYHTTTDCSGTRYSLSERTHNGSFTEFVQTTDGQTGYYASQPAQELLIQSVENNVPDPGFLGVGDCDNSFSPSLLFVATPATLNLNSLATPPFHLE